MLAARGKLGRERAAFRTKNIGRSQGVGEARKIVGVLSHLDSDQGAPFGQLELGKASPQVEGQVSRGFGGIGLHLKRPVVSTDGKNEARPEGVGRPQQIAEIHGLGDALDADGEIPARRGK